MNDVEKIAQRLVEFVLSDREVSRAQAVHLNSIISDLRAIRCVLPEEVKEQMKHGIDPSGNAEGLPLVLEDRSYAPLASAYMYGIGTVNGPTPESAIVALAEQLRKEK